MNKLVNYKKTFCVLLLASWVAAPAAQAGQLFPPANLASAASSCPSGSFLFWTGSTVTCQAINISCASGQYLTGIVNGAATCQAIPTPPTTPNTTTASNTTTSTSTDTGTAAAPNCTASPEICAAYQQSTGRLPDAVGSAYWTAEYNAYTNAGLSPADAQAKIVHDMSGTPEAQNYANTGVANTAPATISDPFGPGTAAITSPSCTGGTSCGSNAELTPLVTAPDPIAQAYQAELGRAPDQAGAAYWSAQYNNAIANGQTPDQAQQLIQQGMSGSSESQAYKATGTPDIGIGYSSTGYNANTSPLCINGVGC